MSAARVVFVLSFDRKVLDGIPVAEVKVDSEDDGDPTTHDQYLPSGEDSQPCVGDAALAVESMSGTGEEELVGFSDLRNAGITAAGEKRIYARNAGGTIVVALHLKADGSAVLSNDAGSLTLELNGSVSISGNLNVAGEVTAKAGSPGTAVKLSTHLHGSGTGPTTAPTPGT